MSSTTLTVDPARIVAGRGGGGGGKSGSGGGASTAPDTLFSTSTVRLIGLIGEGEIGSVVGGLKGVYRNDTPIQNADGSFNFKGITSDFRVGTADQSYMPGFPGVENEIPVGATVKQATPVVATITETNLDRIRVTLFFPALFIQKTDGTIRNNDAPYRIECKYTNGPWVLIGSYVVSGKTSSGYYRQHEFAPPRNPSGVSSPWQVRVVRINQDDAPFNEANNKWTVQSDIVFYSATSLTDTKFTYPRSALFGMTASTSQLGDSVGEIRVLVDGIKMPVPSNRNGSTRAYSGIWDGTLKEEVCDNPAWLLNLLMSDDVFGLGEFIDQAGIDRISLYEIGRYCDQLVDDGSGGREPRFTFNGAITEQQEAFDLLQLIAQIYRGMVYWGSGAVTSTQDRPGDVKYLLTEANVIGGEFKYSSSSRKARHTVAIVSWHDPTNLYRENLEFVESSEGIGLYGYNPIKIDLLGCTSRGQAHRAGLWTLFTELYETQLVTYRAALDHVEMRPGDLISIQDPQISNLDLSGRVVSGTANTLRLDRTVDLKPGVNYAISVVLQNGSVQRVAISGSSVSRGQTIVTLATNLTTIAPVETVWQISGDVVPQLFRVISVKETEPHIYEVTALQHEPSKFAAIDDGAAFTPTPFSELPFVVLPPKNLSVRESQYIELEIPRQSLILSWTAGQPFNTVGYYVTVVKPNGTIVNLPRTASTSMDILDATPGDYRFIVTAIGLTGRVSLPAEITYTNKGWAGVAAPSVVNLSVKGGGAVFAGRSATLQWGHTYPDGMDPYPTRDVVYVFDASTDQLVHREMLPGGQNEWTYTYDINVNEGGPRRQFRVSVAAISNIGTEGTRTSLLVSNPAPAAPGFSLAATSETVFVKIAPSNDLDFQGFLVWVSPTKGFTPTDQNITSDIQSTTAIVPGIPDTTYYVRVAAYDAFSKNISGLSIAAEQEIKCTANLFNPLAPGIPGKPLLTTTAEISADGTLTARVNATWAASSGTNLGVYEISVSEAGGSFVLFRSDSNEWERHGFAPSSEVSVKVRALSNNGFAFSGFSPLTTIITAKNTGAPDNPTNVAVVTTFQNAYLSWTSPTARDLKWIEIWAYNGASTGATPQSGSILLATVPFGTNSYIDSTIGTTATKTYWLRSVNTSDVRAASYTAYVQGVSVAIQGAQLAAGVIDATKFASGLKPVEVLSALPTIGNTDGRIVFSTADKKLYRYDATQGKFVSTVAATDMVGQLTDAQLEKISASKLIGQVVSTQLADASITMEKMFGNLKPIAEVSTLPAVSGYTGPKVVLLATDGKLYRLIAGSWVSQTPAADISGQIANGQIEAIAAGKITGQLTNTQLEAIAATKISGTLTSAQISGLDAAKVAGALTNATMPAGSISGTIAAGQIASLTAGQITGQMSDAQLAGISAAKLAGTITDAQLAGISATKLIGSIIGAQLADNAVNLSKIATGLSLLGEVATLPAVSGYTGPKTILNTTDGRIYRLVSGAWTSGVTAAEVTGQIAAGQIAAIDAGKITGSLTSDQIGALDAAKLTGTIAPVRIPALPATAITGALTSAQIGALDAAKLTGTVAPARIPALPATSITGTLTSAQIEGLDAAKLTSQIVSTQITDSAITTAKVAAGAITAASIAAGSITASKLMIASQNRAYNADLSQGLLGIALGSSSMGIQIDLLYRAATDYAPDGQPSFYMRGAGTPNAGTAQQILLRNVPSADGAVANYAVSAGQIYEFSVAIAALRCSVTANILWYNSTGASLGSSGPNNTISVAQQVGSVVTFPRAWTLGVAPAGAVSAILQVRAIADGGANPSLFGSCLMFASALVGQTEPSPYVDPGVTIIDGSSIRTGSLSADRIIANSITAGQIATNAVTADAIAANAITAGKLAANSVVAANIVAGTITAGQIASDAITSDKILTNSIVAGKIATNAVTSDTIAANAITAVKITAGTITGDKLVVNAITAREIAADSVTAAAILAGSITANKLVANSITAAQLAAGSVTAASIKAGEVTADALAANAVTADKILAGAVTAGKVAANAIVATNIAANQINAGHIVANSITAGQLAANTITASQIASGTITAGEIATGAITAVKIAANSIDASKIVAGSIDTAQLSASAVTAVKIAANSIDASKIVAGSIDTLQLNAGAVTADKIATNAVTANKILAGSITAAKLVAGTITANELAAYSIVASKLAIASSNFAYNPDMVQGTLGFTGSSTTGWTDGVFVLSAVTGAPDGFTALMISGIGTPAAGEFSRVTHRRVINAAGTLDRYQVTAGVAYEFSACLSARRCTGNIACNWYDSSGASINGWTAGTPVTSSVVTGGSVTAFPKSTLIATAPPSAVSVMISYVATSIGQASPALYISAPMYAAAVTGQTECSPYVDVSVTIMDGGNIRTKTLSADALIANTITAAQIASGTLTANEIAAGTITGAKMVAGTIDTVQLAASAVTAEKITVGTITADRIAVGTITADRIAVGTITANRIASATITGDRIAGRTILASNLVAKSITAGEIKAGEITAAEIAARTITAAQIATNAITATEIAGRTITAAQIATGTLTANEIAANSITTGVIAAGAITVAQLAAGAISTDKLGVGLNTGNLLFNSDFLNGLMNWSQVGTGGVSWGTSYTVGPTGLAVAMPTGPSVPDANSVAELRYRRIIADGTSEEFLPVTQLKRYEFSTHLRNTAGHTISMIVVAYASDGSTVVSSTSFVFGSDNLTRSLFSASLARIGGFLTVPSGATQVKVRLRIVYNGTGSVGNPFFTGVYAGLATPNQTEFTDWTPMSNTVIDGGAIATNSITARAIAAATITGDQIAGTTITGSKIVGGTITTTELAASVLTADNIKVGGGTLSNWATGGNTTTIAGGAIEANTILANSLKIGSRGISVRGIEFQAERASTSPFALTGNTIWGSGGSVHWINDAGTPTTTTPIAAGSAPSTLPYIYWIKGELALRATGNLNLVYNNSDAVMMCTTSAAAGIMPVYGGTIIDGTKITALSIAAGQIAAGAIQADKIAANSISASHIVTTGLSADVIASGTITSSIINIGSTRFQLNSSTERLSITDPNGIIRVQLGGLNAAKTSYGMILRDANNSIMLDSGGISASAITGGIQDSQLSGGGSYNQIYNPDCAYGTSGVRIDQQATPAQGGPIVIGTNNGPQYTLRGGYTNWCRGDSTTVNFSSTRVITLSLMPANLERHPAEPGKTYEFSAYIAGHRSRYRVAMIFCDTADATLASYFSGYITGRNGNAGSLFEYDRPFVIGTAPAGTQNAYIVIQFVGTNQPLPFVFWTRMFYGEARPNQTQPSPWSSAGSVAPVYIDNLVANKIQADAITANKLATNSLSALGASIGDLTAGILRSPNSRMVINLNDGYLQINE